MHFRKRHAAHNHAHVVAGRFVRRDLLRGLRAVNTAALIVGGHTQNEEDLPIAYRNIFLQHQVEGSAHQ
jgi:hypothetical protein